MFTWPREHQPNWKIAKRRYAWVRYVFIKERNCWVPDMSGFKEWLPVKEVGLEPQKRGGNGAEFSPTYIMMEQPEDNSPLPALYKIQWKNNP